MTLKLHFSPSGFKSAGNVAEKGGYVTKKCPEMHFIILISSCMMYNNITLCDMDTVFFPSRLLSDFGKDTVLI